MPTPQRIALKSKEKLGIENLFLVNNHENVRSRTIILPDLSSHIVIHLLSNGHVRLRLIGPRTKAIFIDRQKRTHTYILRLRPHALRNLLSFPVSELTNKSMDLFSLLRFTQPWNLLAALAEGVSGTIAENLEEILGNQYNPELCPKSVLTNALITAYPQHSSKSVKTAAKSLGISERYLHKLSIDQIGLAPKLVLRIQRFRLSLIYRQKHPHLSWSQIAQMANYFDQSHMIDEYQEFIGESPGQFFGV